MINDELLVTGGYPDGTFTVSVTAGMKDRLNESYYGRQLNKLEIGEYPATAQFVDGHGIRTNFLSLTKESIPEIIAWLKTVESELDKLPFGRHEDGNDSRN